MKNLYLLFLIFMGTITAYAQKDDGVNQQKTTLSPNGVLDDVFDQYGRKYNLSDLVIAKETKGKKGTTAKTTLITCNSGYFNLYFETGCGMEIAGNPTHDARRAVVCKIFEDLSNFINSPLSTTGKKVNIWIRNINNVITAPDTPNGVLGLASSFYNMPYNTSAGFGGIADNEIWKTIHAGVDSYTNVTSPISSGGVNTGISGIYYHGMVAFNFNTTDNPAIPNNPAINWHTNLSTNASTNLYDLYTVLLHEVTHSLGFASLINGNGTSKFGSGFNYYSRYDRFLKNSGNTQFLITNGSACSSMYNYSFNATLNPAILAPNPTNAACNASNTACATAIRYVGQSNVPVFTPNCFSPPSSLSHFEDQCISAPNANNNNSYFTMADAMSTGMTKRFLRPEERNVLCDLGYNVKSTFGSTVFNGTFNYGGTACAGINVAGINDGLNSNGTFSYSGNAGANITISGILTNDSNASGFECLQDVFSTATFSATSGTATSTIAFSSTVPGLHLLRYVPLNASGQRGNITYIYVYVNDANNCGTPTACNLIINGDFEQYANLNGPYYDNISNTCNWSNGNLASPNYFNSAYTSNITKVPCNTWGFENDLVTGNKAYAGVTSLNRTGSSTYDETIKTQLSTPLIPNTSYQLSFDVSLADGMHSGIAKLQAYLSNTFTTYSVNGNIPITNSSMFFTNPTYSTVFNGWERITFNFTTGAIAGENTLYLGFINNPPKILTPPTIINNTGCNYGNNNDPANPNHGIFYYIDNVKLVPLSLAEFTLPETICLNQTLPNLSTYLAATPTTGVFSGTGVSLQNGVYVFNASTSGTATITYTYTSTTGCSVTISDTINVLAANNPECGQTPTCPSDYTFSVPEPASLQTYQASNTIITTNNYVVPSGYDITLTAGKAITIKAMTHIQNGAVFLAKIQPCSQFMTAKKQQVANINKLRAYPNPASSQVSIETDKEMTEISLISIEGRLIVSKKVGNTNFHQLDIASYQNGIYILTVKNSDGTSEVIKIIKQ